MEQRDWKAFGAAGVAEHADYEIVDGKMTKQMIKTIRKIIHFRKFRNAAEAFINFLTFMHNFKTDCLSVSGQSLCLCTSVCLSDRLSVFCLMSLVLLSLIVTNKSTEI